MILPVEEFKQAVVIADEEAKHILKILDGIEPPPSRTPVESTIATQLLVLLRVNRILLLRVRPTERTSSLNLLTAHILADIIEGK